MTFEEMAWDFVEVFDDLEIEQINEVLAKNVPYQTLEFFNKYSSDFAQMTETDVQTSKQLPNLMLIGYLLRVLEERLKPDENLPD